MNSGIPSLKAFSLFFFIFFLGNAACNNSGNTVKEDIKLTPPKIISQAADSIKQLIAANPDSVIYRQLLIQQLEQDNQIDEALNPGRFKAPETSSPFVQSTDR